MADLGVEVDRYRRHIRYRPLFHAATVLGVVALLILAVVNWHQADEAKAQRVQFVAQARDVGDRIAKSDVCTSGAQDDLDQFGYLCEQARKLKDQAEGDRVDTQALAAAVSALVVASLPARVEQAVQRYMAQHPTASKDEVRDWVKQEVAATPPVPGKDGRDGKDGNWGPSGPGPTDAQVDAAVARWFDTHPPNVCPGVWVPRLATDGTSFYRCEVPTPLPPS